jgi:hypothetical protein
MLQQVTSIYKLVVADILHSHSASRNCITIHTLNLLDNSLLLSYAVREHFMSHTCFS